MVDENSQLQLLPVKVLQSDSNQVAVRGDFGEHANVVVSSLVISVAGMIVESRSAEGIAKSPKQNKPASAATLQANDGVSETDINSHEEILQ